MTSTITLQEIADRLANKLKRAVYFHDRVEIRDRLLDCQSFRASGLNLVVSRIIHWNTIYFAKIAGHLNAQGRDILNNLLRHVSPLTWEHVNLTCIYSWIGDTREPYNLRPRRETDTLVHRAA